MPMKMYFIAVCIASFIQIDSYAQSSLSRTTYNSEVFRTLLKDSVISKYLDLKNFRNSTFLNTTNQSIKNDTLEVGSETFFVLDTSYENFVSGRLRIMKFEEVDSSFEIYIDYAPEEKAVNVTIVKRDNEFIIKNRDLLSHLD